MYISASEYHAYLSRNTFAKEEAARILGLDPLSVPSLSLAQARKALGVAKSKIIERERYIRDPRRPNYDNLVSSLGKWHRPWEVVPKLKDFRPASGDYGVGVEVELGFINQAAAVQVAKHVQHWRYITLDYEGGTYPIELTFPPIPYSTMSKHSQVIRYLDYLNVNHHLVMSHEQGNVAGTHVNVSSGDVPFLDGARLSLVNDCIRSIFNYREYSPWNPTDEQHEACIKYFGRKPYGLGNISETGGRWIEWKLFHSTIDSKRFREYVNVAVSLTRLVAGTEDITEEVVLQALEDGYTGKIRKLIKADKKIVRPAVVVPLASEVQEVVLSAAA